MITPQKFGPVLSTSTALTAAKKFQKSRLSLPSNKTAKFQRGLALVQSQNISTLSNIPGVPPPIAHISAKFSFQTKQVKQAGYEAVGLFDYKYKGGKFVGNEEKWREENRKIIIH